jgi:hypothetical protein
MKIPVTFPLISCATMGVATFVSRSAWSRVTDAAATPRNTTSPSTILFTFRRLFMALLSLNKGSKTCSAGYGQAKGSDRNGSVGMQGRCNIRLYRV